MDIVAADIGGTHARFAIATLAEGRVALGPETVLKTSDYPGPAEAWRAFAERIRRTLPRDAGFAIAAPVHGDAIRMTNNDWVLRPRALPGELGIERLTLLNDFAAVAHAVPVCGRLGHIAGPDRPLPETGVISVIGPGTGLGVALLRRSAAGNLVIPTEGGHIAFAPLDATEEAVAARIRDRHGRASVDRVASGSGLVDIHAVLTGETADSRTLWARALSGADERASESLDRFCAILGSVAGDLALAHGADAVVLAGGLGQRLATHLPKSAFAERFRDKGRFSGFMAERTAKLITHPQPGLLGAAAAFAAEHGG
jgi:glucokinase